MTPTQPQDGREEVTYGFDPASPDGDMSALTVRNGELVFHLFGEEAESVLALLEATRATAIQDCLDCAPPKKDTAGYSSSGGVGPQLYAWNEAIDRYTSNIRQLQSDLSNSGDEPAKENQS